MKALKNLTKWQNYLHYVVLTFAVFGIHYLTDIWGIEKLVVDEVKGAWIILFLFYTIGIFLADTLIHIIFEVVLGWED